METFETETEFRSASNVRCEKGQRPYIHTGQRGFGESEQFKYSTAVFFSTLLLPITSHRLHSGHSFERQAGPRLLSFREVTELGASHAVWPQAGPSHVSTLKLACNAVSSACPSCKCKLTPDVNVTFPLLVADGMCKTFWKDICEGGESFCYLISPRRRG